MPLNDRNKSQVRGPNATSNINKSQVGGPNATAIRTKVSGERSKCHF